MKITIVEDDGRLRDLIKIVLSEISDSITTYENGWQGLDGIIADKPDLIVLDVMMPGIDGIEVCNQLRKRGIMTPIIMLTARAEEDDKVLGLGIGADDYLTKPFSNKELLARCKALLRRFMSAEALRLDNNKILINGSLELNLENHTLHKNKELLEITPKEFDLLALMMSNPGRNYTRLELLDRVWGENFDGLEHTVNTNINRLRMKIEDDISAPQYLLTAWGVGYRFAKN